MPSRELLLCAAANDVGLPLAFAKLLAEECPWLGSEEVNESFGPDLLAKKWAQAKVSRSQAEQFLYAYTAGVRAQATKMPPTPPIERTPKRPFRGFWPAAHVKR